MTNTLSNKKPAYISLQYQQRDLTLQEVADCFDVTKERIRQIEAKAITKMRCRLILRGVKEDFFA